MKKKSSSNRLALAFAIAIMVTGCELFHSYEGDVGYRDVVLHFRTDKQIDQLWQQCQGESSVQAFAIRRDNGTCEVWIPPPKGEHDSHFSKLLYHELGHCEEASFGTTHTVKSDCATEN